MKSASSLNANAASYVPLAKRVVDSKTETLGGAAKITDNSIHAHQGYDERKICTVPNNHENESFPITGNFALQGYYAQGSSQDPSPPTEKMILDEAYDMDLEYLEMRFPELSQESLSDVYLANRGDIEASIDMLNDLEFSPYEFPESLPETLDIGDVAETVPSIEHAALKLKNVVGKEADASSSIHHLPSNN
ncbi:hypothetical protein SAY87_030595 [Trapa incisa]|uniref:CUE domain-containing protein n=1 Tax=Trapa incisa TaxID=236973 RepID=A0AAN7KTE4_9MYRT|nr:hypothetical protein SAY87_030595 [Trapa incisa]